MNYKLFQPILVRPGNATRHGLVAMVAHFSWVAAQHYSAVDTARWLSENLCISVRKSHLPDFTSATELGYIGNATVRVGPLMRMNQAPACVSRSKSSGWSTWGTMDEFEIHQPKFKVIVDESLMLDTQMLARQVARFVLLSDYAGGGLRVEESCIGPDEQHMSLVEFSTS